MKEIILKAVTSVLWTVLGRRNLARFSRHLTNQVRLDMNNEMDSNGERLVQGVILAIAGKSSEPVVVFDAGANVGDWSGSLLDMASRNNNFNVALHAFEPCLATFKKLGASIDRYRDSYKIHPAHMALSNAPGTMALNVVADGAGTNSLYRHIDLEIDRQESIILSTVDIYSHEHGINHIGFLKIDTEGHDYSVIEGAREMLEKGAIDMIQFEYSHRWIIPRHFLRDVFELLQPYGFRIGKITPEGIEFYDEWHFELESFREGNYLACKAEHVSLFPAIDWWNKQSST